MTKFFFTFDKTYKAQNLRKKLLKKYKHYSISKANVIIVGGGDGYMLSVLKKYVKYKKPFFGINCGTFGFLLNKQNSNNLVQRIAMSKKVTIKPLEVLIKNKVFNKKFLAINEVSLFRQSKQTASLHIRVNKKILLNKLIGDGLLVSTPAGSTAYNLSVNGPILSLNSKKLAITPISPFRPRLWKGKTISSSNEVIIKNLNVNKRPVAAVVDNIEIRDIKNIKAKISKKISFNLLYDKNKSLDLRIKIEQMKKYNKKFSNE